jgi:hypothetical protein
MKTDARSQMKTQKGKEVISMKYAKPEIAMLASASSAIQSQGMPKISGQFDSQDIKYVVTNPAYEADE